MEFEKSRMAVIILIIFRRVVSRIPELGTHKSRKWTHGNGPGGSSDLIDLSELLPFIESKLSESSARTLYVISQKRLSDLRHSVSYLKLSAYASDQCP